MKVDLGLIFYRAIEWVSKNLDGFMVWFLKKEAWNICYELNSRLLLNFYILRRDEIFLRILRH